MPETGPEPTFSSLIVDDDTSGHALLARRPASGATRWWIALIVLAFAGAASFYWWRQQQSPQAPPATEAPQAKVEAAPPKAEPAIRHPIDDARARAGLDAGRTPSPKRVRSCFSIRTAVRASSPSSTCCKTTVNEE